MMRSLRVLAITALLPAAGNAAAQEVPLEPGSTVRIEGNSTLHRWSCAAEQVDARVPRDGTPAPTLTINPTGVGELLVPIVSLECGDDRMERQMQAALKAIDHPTIRYTLQKFDIQRVNASFVVESNGTIAVAGVERSIVVAIRGEVTANGVIRATGSAPIRMTDFGITPPTAFFGLLKASDQVTVRFDLRVRQEPAVILSGT